MKDVYKRQQLALVEETCGKGFYWTPLTDAPLVAVVPPEKLLYCAPLPVEDLMADSVPAFFRGVDRLYM